MADFELPTYMKQQQNYNAGGGQNNYMANMQKMQMAQMNFMFGIFAKAMGMSSEQMADMGFGALTGAGKAEDKAPATVLTDITSEVQTGDFANKKGLVKDIKPSKNTNVRAYGNVYDLTEKNDKKAGSKDDGVLGRQEYEEDLKYGWANNFNFETGSGKELFNDEQRNDFVDKGFITKDGFDKEKIQARIDNLESQGTPTDADAREEYLAEARSLQGLKAVYSDPQMATKIDKASAQAEKDINNGFTVGDGQVLADQSAITVEKDGKVHLDAGKLTAEELTQLNYGGDQDIVIDNLEDTEGGRALDINITGDAQNVILDGEGSANIKTNNEALQVKADKDSGYTVAGENLKHVVAQGGTFKGIEGKTDSLEALKVKNAKLDKALEVNSQANLSVNLDNVKGGKDVNVNQAEGYDGSANDTDSTVRMSNSAVGDVNVRGEDAALTISGGKAGDVNLEAAGADNKGDAKFRAFRGAQIGDATIKATDDANINLNGADAGTIDAEGVEGQTQVFAGDTAEVSQVKMSDDEKNLVVFENDSAKDNFKTSGKFNEEMLSSGNQEAVYKQFFDMSGSEYSQMNKHINRGTANNYSQGWGSTPNSGGKYNWLSNFSVGFAQGVQDYYSPYRMGYQQQQYYGQPMYRGQY